jgi:hypothetical protein
MGPKARAFVEQQHDAPEVAERLEAYLHELVRDDP